MRGNAPLFLWIKKVKAMSAEHIDDITIAYEEDGTLLIEELGKKILSKGLNTTILFRYREWDSNAQAYGPEKYSIRRYKKTAGIFRQQNKFNISSAKQARLIIEALSDWVAESGEGD